MRVVYVVDPDHKAAPTQLGKKVQTNMLEDLAKVGRSGDAVVVTTRV